MPLGIDATIRYAREQLDAAAAGLRARARQPVQHAPEPRPAADADRQPRPGVDQGRRQPRPRQGLPVLRAQAGRQRRARVLVHRRAVPARRREVPGLPRAVDRDAPARRLRLARRPLALAGDARGGVRGTSGLNDWHYQKLPMPPELFAETVRALPAAGFRGVNVTIPHKEAALALADEASDAARAIGAANTLTFERDGAIHADNTDAPGLIAALGRARGTRPAARARARRRRGRARRRVGARAGRRRRRGGLEPHARARRRRSPAQLGARAVRRARRGRDRRQLHVRRAERMTAATFKALPLQADSFGAGSCVVDMVYRDGGTRLLEAARTRGADVVDGLEILVAQGAASFERWTGRTAPRRGDAGGRRSHRQHMNPPAQTGAPPNAKRPKKGNGVTSPSRRGGSGRVLTTCSSRWTSSRAARWTRRSSAPTATAPRPSGCCSPTA